MARTSKLNEKQWAEIAKLIESGETYRSVGARFGIAESAIRKRLGAQRAQDLEIKTLATQLVTAEQNIRALPISAQVSAHGFAENLRAASLHLAGAAKFGAATAHRLNAIANSQVQKLDDVDPMSDDGMETLRNIAVLSKTAIDASYIPVNLIKSSKEALDADSRDNKPMLDATTRAARIAQLLGKR